MSQRNLIIAGLFLAVLLADFVLWLAGSWLLSAQAGRWAQQAEGHGWTISWNHEAWTGWPFSAGLIIDKPAASGGGRYLPGGLAWSADHIVVSVSIAHPFTLRVGAEGQQFLRLAHAPDLGFVAGVAVARLPLGRLRQGRATLQLADVTGGIAGSRYPQDVQLGALSLSVDAEQDEAAANPRLTARLDLQASNIGLPDIGRWPLGATIAGAGATVLLTSPLPGRTRPDTDRDALQAATWHDKGGTVVVQQARLRWGPLGISASAAIGLDGRLQPAGTGTAEAIGTAPALDAAAQAGLIAPGMAATAKIVIAMMTHVRGPEGDAVRLPFRLHDSTVSVGEIPVARLPEISW